MSSDLPLTVIAHLKAKPGSEGALRDALLGIVSPTRAEAGCNAYELHVSADDSRHFIVYEQWANDAALAAHFDEEHLKSFVAKVADIISEPVSLEKLRPIAR